VIGAGEHYRVALVPTFNKNQFEVQIVSHRNRKKEKHKGTSQPSRRLKRTVAAACLMKQRNDRPRECRDENDRKPQEVKELLHCFELSPSGEYAPA
jgi:hypothetical protein